MLAAKPAPVGSRGVDSLPFSQGGTPGQAKAMKAAGIDFVALYLGVAQKEQADACSAAGLGVLGVTTANSYDGLRSSLQAKALGLPAGTSLFIDVEGIAAYKTPIADLTAKINQWADVVAHAGYVPGLYIASPQPMTSDELYKLHVVRYWRAPARIVDRNGQLAEPRCGWCMSQLWPSRMWAGVYVDVDFVGEDHDGRVPMIAA